MKGDVKLWIFGFFMIALAITLFSIQFFKPGLIDESFDDLVEGSITFSNGVLSTEFLTKRMVFGKDYISKDAGIAQGTFVFNVKNPLTDKQAKVTYSFINFLNFVKDYKVEERCVGCGEVINTTLVCDEEKFFDGNATEIIKTNCVEDRGVLKTYDLWQTRGDDKHSITLEPLEETQVKITAWWNESSLIRKVKIDVVPHFKYTKSDSSKVDMARDEWTLWQTDDDNLIVWMDCENDLDDRANGGNQAADNTFTDGGDISFTDGGYGDGKFCELDSDDFMSYPRGDYWLGASVNNTGLDQTDYSICHWVNTSSAGNVRHSFGDITPGTDKYGLFYSIFPNMGVSHNDNNVNMGYDPTSDIQNVPLAYVCLVYDKSITTATLYIDGVYKANGTVLEQTTEDTFTFWINADLGGVTGAANYDEITLWNKTLTGEDTLDLFNAGGVPAAAPIGPTCSVADTNITVDENSGTWVLDANMSEAINISCFDVEGDALFYDITTQSGAGIFSLVMNDVLQFTTSVNTSGVALVTINVSDGITGDVTVDANVTVTAVNNAPWWDNTDNDSYNFNNFPGYHPLVFGDIKVFFRDVEDDKNPDNVTNSVNESSADCFMDTPNNFTVFCSADGFTGGRLIISVTGEDSGGLTADMSFEININQPPSVPTVTAPAADIYQGNITLSWDASVSPQGDEIAFYNVTLNASTIENVQEIVLTNVTSYSWDTREYPDANDLLITVEACDNNSLCNADGGNLFSINNTPHWDPIGNSTATNISSNFGKQAVLDNASQYFRDFFDDQTPSTILISTNESGMACTVETNFSIFCTPTVFVGDYIMILNGTNSVANSSFESFEGLVINDPPTIPTDISPEDNHLNDTLSLNLSCLGSTDPQNDTIFYDFYGDTNINPSTLVCLNTGGGCLWNYTITNVLHYWYCQSNDTTENSTPITTRSIRTETWDVIDVNQTSPATGLEGESVVISKNISYNEIRYKDINSRLNTSWPPFTYTPVKNGYDNYTEFIVTLDLPSVTTDTEHYFKWDTNLTYLNDSTFVNSSYNGSITVENIFSIENCTGNSTDAVAANFSFRQENTLQEFNFLENDSGVSLDVTFIIYKDDISINTTTSYSLKNQTYFTLCIPEGKEYLSLAQIDYIKDSFDKRQYYFVNQTLNNQTDNISLYLLEISLGSGITINVEDKQGNPIENAYIYVYKYDSGTDELFLISMGLTNADGQEYLFLRKFDTFYKFEVRKDGVLQYADTIQRKISDDSIILRTGAISLKDLLDNFDTISFSLYNTTDTIVLEYSDSGTLASQYCLTVYKSNSSDDAYVCEICLTAKTGVITCDTTGDDGLYIANAWATINPDFPFATLIVDKIKELITGFGKTGLFGSFLIILTLGCIGVYIGRVYSVVVGILVGLFISKMLGMLQMNYGTFMGFLILGIIISIYAKD